MVVAAGFDVNTAATTGDPRAAVARRLWLWSTAATATRHRSHSARRKKLSLAAGDDGQNVLLAMPCAGGKIRRGSGRL